MFSLHDIFNARALEIWASNETQTRMPILHSNINGVAKLVIVGMNPSHNLDWVQREIDKKQVLGDVSFTAEELLAWPSGRKRIEDIKKMEKHAVAHYPHYFNGIQRFADAVGFSNQWQHLDIFLMRETSQAVALKAVMDKGAPPEICNQFGKEQIGLLRKMLGAIRPRVVVIANAKASKILRLELELIQEPNEPATFTSKSLPDTRFFTAGMLSGQRCMDDSARERLVFQVTKYAHSLTASEGPP